MERRGRAVVDERLTTTLLQYLTQFLQDASGLRGPVPLQA